MRNNKVNRMNMKKALFIGICKLLTNLYMLVSSVLVLWTLAGSNNKALNLLSVIFGILLLINLFTESRHEY